ncbi:Xaa-Pro peptidase family protein [Myxococcota bacterium]|nr:Xaa-Pro peptidase family protein [Myxococcota bacterium]MBU1381805.1 Xaa-Pro peptidase family protein [Myxococcota bacterium]MBU1498582.1 Xaa-Pro peptidase family protein [Myxococcota bacterium]
MPVSHENRIKQLSEKLCAMGLDIAIVIQNADMYYFTGTISQGFLVVSSNGEYELFVSKPFERVKEESDLFVITKIRSIKDLFAKLKDRFNGSQLKIGLELDTVPYSLAVFINRSIENSVISDISPAIRDLRTIKDEFEIEMISSAGKILAKTFQEIADFNFFGKTELELSAFIESHMRLSGHQGYLRVRKFNMELYYGALGVGKSVCHPTLFDGPVGNKGLYPAVPYFAGKLGFSSGDSVLVDLMAGYEGYIADGTRTYFLGSPSESLLENYFFCTEISDFVASELKPGVIPSSIYNRCIEIAETRNMSEGFMGFGENRVKFIGHGLGLEIDEFPVIAKGFDAPLVSGNVIAVEPKFFTGEHGVGIENTYLVTASGGKNLIPLDNSPFIIK